ncbi:non-heme chloroperoxidase [Actinoplanes lobatus]|uniref:Non-heme chloroperoxidase n=1 Tax=Actinoplanes lobatus TaxID=113568 RepID=A0A7W7HPD9_9ACTN|nr:alpha/beta hydrolase [Actinoplanes lobatus]MBB4754109.1 proline iminopeptidase [Actinoplanes lobatus]GGN76907.1 non-heme chloroperoxidase [Actinoplanes lobatus]GIE40836.1 non-heme chloroperoxidase [Actinoplanes lobatus]
MRVRAGDVRLHVTTLGDEYSDGQRRPDIIAVHGGPGIDGGMLRLTMRPAVGYAHVIVPDLRGHGRSDRGEPADWNLDVWADDLAALIDTLGLPSPYLLGTSFGGFVVQRFLSRHPETLAGAILIGTGARQASHDEIVERHRVLGGDRAADVMRRSLTDHSPEAEREWAEVCGPLAIRRAPDEDYQRAVRNRISTPEINAGFISQLSGLDLRPDLAAARRPVMVLVGEYDPLIPYEVAAETVDSLPAGTGELHVVPGASHQAIWDAPDATHALIRKFTEGS